ncbi:MAG: ABC transporter permease, partial [Oscillospiraceae bacterium]
MQMIKAVYLNEIFKISKKKKIVVAAILCVFSVIVACLIVMSVGNFMGISMTASSEFPILVLPVLINTLVPLFTAFICIDMFTGEFVF